MKAVERLVGRYINGQYDMKEYCVKVKGTIIIVKGNNSSQKT